MNKKQTQTPPSTRKILLVDEHAIVRYGIKLLIGNEPDLEYCGDTSNILDALKKIKKSHPDLIMVDISMQGASWLELIKALQGIAPHIPVLVISMHNESIYAERALQAGARGFVMKHEPVVSLLTAIHKLLDGGTYLPPDSPTNLRHIISSNQPNRPTEKFGVDSLSDRELEVFEFIGRGKTSREIAEKLKLSIKTIETHRAHVKQKLKISTSTELVHRAFHWVESGRNLG